MAENLVIAPVVPPDTIIIPPQTAEAPPAHLPAPTEAEVRAIDGAFASHTQADLVAGLLSMQVGIMVLRDVAIETVEEPLDEKEKARRQRARDDDRR